MLLEDSVSQEFSMEEYVHDIDNDLTELVVEFIGIDYLQPIVTGPPSIRFTSAENWYG